MLLGTETASGQHHRGNCLNMVSHVSDIIMERHAFTCHTVNVSVVWMSCQLSPGKVGLTADDILQIDGL